MRVWFFLIFLFSPLGIFFSCFAHLGEQQVSLEDPSENLPRNRLHSLAKECVGLYQEHGYVGISLHDLRPQKMGDISLLPNEECSLSRFERLFFKKGKSLQRIGEENLFLFLIKKGKSVDLSHIEWQIYVESTYHHINDIGATARGEAPCYRDGRQQTVLLTSLVEKLCSKRDAPVSGEFWCHVYDRFLSTRGGKRLKEFLIFFVKEIDSPKIF